jgi:hypothetical protein
LQQPQGETQMKTKELLGLIALGIVASAVQPSFPARAESSERTTKVKPLQLATGQYITPLALSGSVQQFLNPGLPAYPNFIAGEAVRSQLSPDGTTLAILCAGQNSLDDAAGNTDVANSTQYIFLYDVGGANKEKPALTQVIQQTTPTWAWPSRRTESCTPRAAGTTQSTSTPGLAAPGRGPRRSSWAMAARESESA